MFPEFSLSVQYAVDVPELPRWRVRRWVARALAGAFEAQAGTGLPRSPGRAAALTLRWVDETEGRELNQAYRGRDYATNVLTFEYGADPGGWIHGDIVLCVPVLRRELASRRDPETPDTPSHASRVKAKYGDAEPRQPRPNANRGDNVTGGSPYQDTPQPQGAAFGL